MLLCLNRRKRHAHYDHLTHFDFLYKVPHCVFLISNKLHFFAKVVYFHYTQFSFLRRASYYTGRKSRLSRQQNEWPAPLFAIIVTARSRKSVVYFKLYVEFSVRHLVYVFYIMYWCTHFFPAPCYVLAFNFIRIKT